MKARGLVIMPHGVDSVNNSNRNQCFMAMMLKLSTLSVSAVNDTETLPSITHNEIDTLVEHETQKNS